MVGVDCGQRRVTTWAMMRAMMWATGTMAATMPAMTPAKGMAGTPAGRGGGAPGGGRGGGGSGSGDGSGGGCILQGSLLFIVKIYRKGQGVRTSYLNNKVQGLMLPYLAAGSDVKIIWDARRNKKNTSIDNFYYSYSWSI
jgi:hypothetical protein